MFFRLAEKGRSLPEHGSPGISPSVRYCQCLFFRYIATMQTHWKKPCPAVFLAGLILLSGGPLGVSPVSAKNENFWPAPSEKAAKPIVSSRFSDMNTPAKEQHSGSFNMGQAVRYALEHNPGLGSSEAAARASEEAVNPRASSFPETGHNVQLLQAGTDNVSA